MTNTPVKYQTADIKDVQIGELLLGKNPLAEEVDDFVPEIIPSEWRLLYLRMDKANGKRLEMQFLQPLDWMIANGAELGASIDLDLPEFGAQGPAKVVSIEACPLIKSGSGNVVTGKYIHESDGNLIDLKIEGQQEATTVTANHRYWSADRNGFVEAGHLKPGEQVQTLAGLRQVASVVPRTGNETVYNLEVQGEHVYLVGSLGALVHNNCFKGKAYKDVDWEHIFERHHIDGAIAKQRNRPDEIISGTQDEIKKKVLNSWKNRKKVHTQVLPEGEKRIR
ncbi:MAG TPA: hypothetical protein DIT97_00295 [Gimesia maris]|uniref:Uncharacterized protein n=1 Tax=Gimesia maris TaxID=122 RepID=A0A3D3QYB2_9PLAN|nr:hypothetical protein [Gimesia maris]